MLLILAGPLEAIPEYVLYVVYDPDECSDISASFVAQLNAFSSICWLFSEMIQ